MNASCICLWRKLSVVKMTGMLSMLISEVDGDFFYLFM